MLFSLRAPACLLRSGLSFDAATGALAGVGARVQAVACVVTATGAAGETVNASAHLQLTSRERRAVLCFAPPPTTTIWGVRSYAAGPRVVCIACGHCLRG